MTFGLVLHAIVERHLKADASGRGPDGKAVDLYPPGWQEVEGARIDPADEPVVKELVAQAIAAGYLARLPGRRVEHGFAFTEGDVSYKGRIDIADPPGGIVDHKTVKAMRYALTPEQLADNDQLLFYALQLAREFPEQQTFRLSHIIYDRTRVKVELREVSVTRAQVEARWAALRERAARMDALQAVTDWRKVPGALGGPNQSKLCAAPWGACKFLQICAGQESTDKYRARYARAEEDRLSRLSELMARLNQAPVVPTGTAPAPASPAEVVAEVLGTGDPVFDGAEVAEEKCVACGGTGKNSKGGYCVCPLGTRRAQEDRTDLTEIASTAATAERRQRKPCTKCKGPIEKGQDYLSGGEGKAHLACPQVVVDIPPPEPQAESAVEIADAAAEDHPSEANPDLTHSDFGGSPGPILLHGCALIAARGADAPNLARLPLSEVLRIAVEDIGQSTLAEFYASDCWSRRDKLKGLGSALAERLGSSYVVCRAQLDQDEQALVAGLSPHASLEIAALR